MRWVDFLGLRLAWKKKGKFVTPKYFFTACGMCDFWWEICRKQKNHQQKTILDSTQDFFSANKNGSRWYLFPDFHPWKLGVWKIKFSSFRAPVARLTLCLSISLRECLTGQWTARPNVIRSPRGGLSLKRAASGVASTSKKMEEMPPR